MNRTYRAFVVALLSLLLLGMQSEGLRHALTHRAAALSAPQEQSLVAPNDVPCVECGILASGANAIGGGINAAAMVSILPVLAFALPQSTPQPAPSYYQSRAPPALL